MTPGIGTPPDPNSDVVHWNEIFGTTRSVDLVFALFLDGTGPASKPIKLKEAFLYRLQNSMNRSMGELFSGFDL
jgi:hypothetical protein